MKRATLYYAAIPAAVVALVLALLSGCSDSSTNEPGDVDTTAANQQLQLAYESLENQFQFWFTNNLQSADDYDQLNFRLANAAYKQALQFNPTSAEAHFGAAITELLCAYADTAINNTIKRWQGTSSARLGLDAGIPLATRGVAHPLLQASVNIVEMYKLALNDPPLISHIQTLVRERLLPRINYAIDRMTYVERDTSFRFRVSGRMQGDNDLTPVYLYVTEVFLADAGLQGTKVLLEQFLMYRFDLPDYSQASLLEALRQNNTTFFVLAPDGMTHAASAKTALTTMLTKLDQGVHSLETISGQRDDAAIKLSDIRRADLDSVKSFISQAQSAMQTPLSVLLRDADSEGNDYTIRVYPAAIFDNPAVNPKSELFPAYTVEPSGTDDIKLQFSAQTYDAFVFPDPTFRGMFPGMTNTVLKRILRIDEQFGYDLQLYVFYEGSWTSIPDASLRIQTSLRTYVTTTDMYGNARFIILDQNEVPFGLFIAQGSGDVELAGPEPFVIRAKTREYGSVCIPMQPTNVTLERLTSPLRIRVSWLPQLNAPVKIQRSTGSGSIPVDYDSVHSAVSYTDYNVTGGQTYRYRVRTWKPSFSSWQIRPVQDFYSDVAEIVP